jgi:autotransporter translocation and assembly factor TamB
VRAWRAPNAAGESAPVSFRVVIEAPRPLSSMLESGLDRVLAGRIRIVSGPAGSLLAKTAVPTIKGTYMAVRPAVDLERDQVIFDGPVDNPALDIRAMRKQPEQFVTVGKRVSDDIYIVYEPSLGVTANVLKLGFNLTRRLLLRAETGGTSALGLFHRWAFD